jgi:GntR family transcriptional regulator / MocR family aminotransferase
MRRIYAERHEALCRAARRELAGALDIVPSHSGLHTIGWLSGAASEQSVVAAAEQRDVTVSPITRFAIAPVHARGLVLGFGGVSPQQIENGVQVLAAVLGAVKAHRRAALHD